MSTLTQDEWREKFVNYYETNVPTKVRMVNDAMMAKWDGKYESLMTNLEKKYGPLGAPIEQLNDPPPAPSSMAPGGAKSGTNGMDRSIENFRDFFEKAIAKEARGIKATCENESEIAVDVIQEKEKNAFNGLETSTFTVCSRIRPILPSDGTGGDAFNCIIPGPVGMDMSSENDAVEWKEEAVVMTPKVGITGRPKIEKTAHAFDYVFGPEVQGDAIFDKIGNTLTSRALAGQVGVVFAYGQTGSGKTHTMNHLLSALSNQLFIASGDSTVSVEFSYLEILGQACQDCLRADAPDFDQSSPAKAGNANEEEQGDDVESAVAANDGAVRIGEMLDGSVKTLNLSSAMCSNAAELDRLVAVAQARRATKATTRNLTSSRSHGVAILKVRNLHAAAGAAVAPAPGVLYIIDLAGSERLADSKDHSDERMEETKAINLSLMSLKECIRARTMAGAGDGRMEVHVPYRRSKLTLLMKDVFDISCARLCSTVVLAHVSPLARDVQHSSNTLGYAAPLRVATRINPHKVGMTAYEKDPNDPVLWNAAQCTAWVRATAPAVEVSTIIDLGATNQCGIALCRTPEPEFFRRVTGAGGSAEDAQKLYSALWVLICDAKVRKRRPNGTIITAEQEEAARLAEKAAHAEKARIWKEREKHLKTEY